MILYQILTGHNKGSVVRRWVIISPFVPRFCSSKVIETDDEGCSNGSVCSTNRLPWKNLIFFTQSNFVFRLPWTAKYSQERIAKQNCQSINHTWLCPFQIRQDGRTHKELNQRLLSGVFLGYLRLSISKVVSVKWMQVSHIHWGGNQAC